MMLHPFHIMTDLLGGNPQKKEKISQNLMSATYRACNKLTFGRQDQPPILFMMQKSLSVKAFNHVGHACLGNPQAAGNVHHPCVAFGIDEFLNALQIILCSRG